jgi:hypothetical protein
VNKPYENDREASAAARAAVPPEPGHAILSQEQRSELLHRAFAESGVQTSDFEDRSLWWLANYEDYLTAMIARWVRAAYENGKAAGPDGAVTEWGFRYTSDDGGDVVMSYPLLDVQQMGREFPPGLASTRTAVARQAGPWAEAEVPASVGCRHCAGTIIPCEPRHDHPACLGWKHAVWLSMGPVGPHYCEGRSVNPSAEPGEDEGDE